jgi:predicted NAD/FAD-dependent oxidoreductase
MAQRIAIIGAGLAGLAAALRLSEAGAEVTVFEKSRGLSGRAATRSKEGCRYDFGASYFKVSSNEVARLIFETLPTEGLTRIVGDILPFDRHGVISRPDTEGHAGARWNYRDGISTLGKLIVARGGFTVENGVRLTRLEHAGGRWHLEAEEGRTFEDFHLVLLTPPAPQTADLLESSDLGPLPREALIGELRQADYFRQFSVVLNYPGEIALPGGAYALINTDRDHDLAWVSLENRKSNRIPPGQTVFVVQLSPLWSERHYEDPPASVIAHAADRLGELLGIPLPDPSWSDLQRWRYAHPRSAADPAALAGAASLGLYFAGDCLVGRGRIADTIETGFAAADAMLRGSG